MSSPSLGYASLGGTNNHNANTMEIIQASLRIWNIQGLPVFPTSFPSLPRGTKNGYCSRITFSLIFWIKTREMGAWRRVVTSQCAKCFMAIIEFNSHRSLMRPNFSFIDVKTEMQKSELIFICPSPSIKKGLPL